MEAIELVERQSLKGVFDKIACGNNRDSR